MADLDAQREGAVTPHAVVAGLTGIVTGWQALRSST
jgi:hypothetical protein